MTRTVNVEVQKGLWDVFNSVQARSTAKNTSATAQNTELMVGQLGVISSSIDQLNIVMQQAGEIADRQSAELKKQTAIAEIAQAEKREQKAIKDAVFAFKKDVDSVVKNTTGLKQYFELLELLSVCNEKLVQYINKLEEIPDKEYADKVITTINESINAALKSLTEEESSDLSLIGKLSGNLTHQKQVINERLSELEDKQKELAKEAAELKNYEYQLFSVVRNNNERPSKVISGVKLLAFIVGTVSLYFIPLLLLIFERGRDWIGNAWKGAFGKPAPTNDLERKVFIAKSEVEKKLLGNQIAETKLTSLKSDAAQLESEVTSIFKKYSLA